MSVAGGVSKAVERAVLHRCEALQIFSRNANRWQAPPLDKADVKRFRALIDAAGITPAVSHGSYLMNLAAANPPLRAASIAALKDELDRAETLGLLGVVIHPGTCTSGTEPDALEAISKAIATVFRARKRQRALVILEHTAGQGRSVGHRFEQLAAIISHLDGSPRIAICLDTCHLVASGYDIASPEGYENTVREFDRLIGLDRLQVIHGNDSKKPCASRVDRHEHVGKGCVGLEAFRRLMHDSRLDGRPILIETEKSEMRGPADRVAIDPLDEQNLDALRALRRERPS